MNLLDEGLMPYSSFNFSVVPTPDRTLLENAPSPADPGYAEKAMQFVRANVPDSWDGMPVSFHRTFISTVRFEDAFPDGRGEPGLLPLLNLELWGLPTSRPAYDPNNKGFVYQRFQRGIMHYDAATEATQGLLLGEYLKAIMVGKNLPPDVESAAASSGFYRQYDPSSDRGPLRPAELAGSRLDGAFEPGWGDPRFGVVVAGSGVGDAGYVAATLATLGAGSWYSFEKDSVKLRGRVELIRPGANPAELADRARARRGAAWMVGNEPNVPGQDDLQPAAYADFLHQVSTALKAGDPTALIVGPNVLNWEKSCNGCPGYTAGRVWTEGFVAAYRERYGKLPFEVFGIHSYSLDWDSLPLVDSAADKEQLLAARRWLDAQGLKLPIWLTEFGVIWGFEGIDWVDQQGSWQARPVGRFRDDLVGAYMESMLAWLCQSGRSAGIERWFLYATAPPAESYASRPAGISLIESTGLVPTQIGQRFRAWSKADCGDGG